jgi:hypothetical protein
MKINLLELQHISVALKQLSGTVTTKQFKDDIDNLYSNIQKFMIDEKKKVQVDIKVKGENNGNT